MMSSITLLRTNVEKKNITAITAIAPMKAAIRMAAKPVSWRLPMESPPPKNSITRATPSPAPLLIPNTLGPARGFRNAVCNSRPLTASAAPQNIAVKACGRRDCRIINCHEAFCVSSPIRMRTTSLAGMDTDPISRFMAKSATITMARPMQ